MDTDDVRAFVAVAEAGSVSRAAAELHLTQQAVTNPDAPRPQSSIAW